MSKLYSKYLEQKALNPNELYLFKSGIFYMALNEDANRLSDALSLKVTNITDKLYKCCFPVSKSDYYFKTLESLSINYKIINEIIIYENGKYYDIISYEKGQEKLSYYQKLYGKSNDLIYFKYLLHKETYIFKKSKNFKTLKNIIYLFFKTI